LPDSLTFERLGRERGFPSETITAILRDRAGFLWIGSREGVAIWDGYEVRVFQHVVSDPTSLSDNAVRRFYEDRSGRLWVGLESGGLQWLDRATWTFETYRNDPADPRGKACSGATPRAGGDTSTDVVMGNPAHICTSHVERQNLTMRMSMRRFARLTNAFSKKVDNLRAAVALHFAHYNFVRIHRSLRVTPAMAARIQDSPWEIGDLVGLAN
jgi:ligand-binding sensor domain-containing protein